jgi:hypothetical protein
MVKWQTFERNRYFGLVNELRNPHHVCSCFAVNITERKTSSRGSFIAQVPPSCRIFSEVHCTACGSCSRPVFVHVMTVMP